MGRSYGNSPSERARQRKPKGGKWKREQDSPSDAECICDSFRGPGSPQYGQPCGQDPCATIRDGKDYAMAVGLELSRCASATSRCVTSGWCAIHDPL